VQNVAARILIVYEFTIVNISSFSNFRHLIFIRPTHIFNPFDCLSLASEERVAVNERAGTETSTT